MGAPESNAGDAFHFWWAATRALALIQPGSDLRLVAVEGLAFDDDPADQYETVDLAEYYGGTTVSSATHLVLSQLKHSTRHPDTAWSTARLCQRRRRRGARGSGRSVAADLAAAYRRMIDNHGSGGAAKTTVSLVTNQPADPALVDAVAAAASWVRAQPGTPTSATLLASLDEPHREVIAAISNAVGDGLRSLDFSAFIASLDLSNAGALGHAALARTVRAGVADLTSGMAPDSARRLFHLVQQEALPGGARGGLTADDVLAELGAGDVADLYPAPPRLPDVPDALPAPAARAIAAAATAAAASGSTVIAHGPAGAGKTTALVQARDHLPAGSAMVVFDCYGGGDYLSSGDERHTPQRFVTQLVNELAQRYGTPLLVQPPLVEPDLWRRLGRTLASAAATLDKGAVLVIAVDAADNAAVAARDHGDRGFLPGLEKLRLPEAVAVVLTARTHRVDMLEATNATTVEVAPFDSATSMAHLRRHQPTATDEDAAEFHARTGGNPRAQFYALAQAEHAGADIPALLRLCDRTPEPIFKDLVESALYVSGAGTGGEEWLAAMLALARPVPVATLAAALDVDPAAVAAFAAGLDPGVKVTDGAIQFRDEDFETYVRGRVDPSAVILAHDRLATMFLGTRHSDADAAAHVANHLAAAGRNADLLELVLAESSPVGIADGFRREQVQARRLDLAARAAAESGDAAAAVRVASRGCDTASRLDTLTRLVDARLDLVARYADIELLRTHALRQTRRDWLGPILMRLAAALSRNPHRRAEARAELDKAHAWLQRWKADRDGETQHWQIEAADVAAAAEAQYRLDGLAAAVDELARWRPLEFAVEAAAALADRIGGEMPPEQAREALRDRRIALAAQAPVLASFAAVGAVPASDWINEVMADLVAADPPRELQPWHADMLDTAVRAGDPGAATGLARRWARELPTHRWSYNNPRSPGMVTLRCHAAAAVLASAPFDIADLVPKSLQPPPKDEGRSHDPRGHDRREWLETTGPLAGAAELAVRAATGAATADDVDAAAATGLAARLARAGHRWFAYDHSYRTWSCLIAEAAIDTAVPKTLIDRLAEAAPALLRDGAPQAWLDLAGTLASRGAHLDRAIDLCLRAADAASAPEHSAADRLELLGSAAELAARLDDGVGRALFDRAVDAATGINDDAARLLAVHADLACRANLRAEIAVVTAARLIAAAEALLPYVSDAGIVPYSAVAGAAARLHPPTGLAAASRWDDEDRVALSITLPVALVAAVDHGEVPAWQALPLDHLVDDDDRRLTYQLDIAARLNDGGASGRTAARLAVTRAAEWIRHRVTARKQPGLAARLLDWAARRGLDSGVRTELDAVVALAVADPPGTSRDWSPGPPPASAQVLLEAPATRSWRELPDDVAALDAAHIYGDQLDEFITGVLLAVAPADRVAALDAVAALPERHSNAAVAVVARCLDTWRSWPDVRDWARGALPRLVADHLAMLAWRSDTDTLLAQLRALDDDHAIRRAVLLALPEVRPQLSSHGWQNVAALLGRLCPPDDAAAALLGLLDDRVPPSPPVPPTPDDEPTGPIVPLLWSVFGHPHRAMRWRAAHAARELLVHTGSGAAPLAAALVGCLDREGAGVWRDPALHFYRLSAVAALLVALHRTALDRPGILVPHRDEFIRHATSRELPHAQIRELARLAGLAVVAPDDPVADVLRAANAPDRCHATHDRQQGYDDRRISPGRRYDFDQMDTIPYWYAPLARVFDIPVDTVAEGAEVWVLDRWGLDRDDWWTDARELRNERSWERMSNEHGSIPPQENLRLYAEYHAMMAAAGELADAGTPMRLDDWDDHDPWRYWLDAHLPRSGTWLADLAAPVPADPKLFGVNGAANGIDDSPAAADYDGALGLEAGTLPDRVIVDAVVSLRRPGNRESVYIHSALASPAQAADLQRALAAASDPWDWKLPYEGAKDFEVDAGDFQLRGWIIDSGHPHQTLDEHDPYAASLQHALPMPGSDFRRTTASAPDSSGLALMAPNGSLIATAEQWADPDHSSDTGHATSSSGYRVRVNRKALLRHLTSTSRVLIVEVQFARHRDERHNEYRPPHSRIYLVDGDGRVTGS